ncbi:MAG: tetratricopeptide repeat protein [Firmicutes bacterium]|nr:tetratricopeptide repeat protein [Bacillota bacterium]
MSKTDTITEETVKTEEQTVAASNGETTPEFSENQETYRREGVALERMAEAGADRNRFQEALEGFRSAFQCYRKAGDRQSMGRMHYRMGFCLEQLQKYKEAISAYNESKGVFQQMNNLEDYAIVADKLAKLHYFKNNVDEAVAEYRSAIEIGCKNAEISNNLGFILIDEGEYEEAKTHLVESVKLRESSDNSEVHLSYNNLGVIEFILGNYEQAAETFKKGVEADKRDPEDDRTIQYGVFIKPEYQGVKFCEFQVFQDVDTKVSLMLNQAASLGMLGKMAEAEKLLSEALTMDKERPYLYEAAGWFYINKGEDKRAVEYFQRALPYDPSNEDLKKVISMINPYINLKIGRNDACPCGSGKKYKKCHGGVI